MTAYDRLSQIIPQDQALANKALAVGLKGITGISAMLLPVFANAVSNVQTTYNLPLIAAQTAPISTATADYYQNLLATGTGTNGTVVLTDVLGTAIGTVSANALSNSVTIINSMPVLGSSANVSSLIGIYTYMADAVNGVFGNVGNVGNSDPTITIPNGPAAGTYPTVELAFIGDAGNGSPGSGGLGLIPAAEAEIAHVVSTDSANVTLLNTNWTDIMDQLALEQENQALSDLNFNDLVANSRNSIYGFILGLPQYGQDTTVGGTAQFIQDICDLNTLTGQAIVAVMRQGQTNLQSSGIISNSNVPADPVPPPPQATLLPSNYPYP